jgi:DNA polymerase IV
MDTRVPQYTLKPMPCTHSPHETDRPLRRIAHLDMDAFYAGVELLRYSELKGLPVVVGGRHDHAPVTQADGTRVFARLGDYVGRGVITTSTYEARALGVFSGMGTMKAAQKAPHAVLLPVDFQAYRLYSSRFKAAVAAITPIIEDRGIDEIYIDLTAHPEPSLLLAQRLKKAVWDATGLTCSIGITPNKLLSKISSELDKPDGVTILGLEDLPHRIWPLPVIKINGIGPKAAQKLANLGIVTIGQLAQTPPEDLQAVFGSTYACWLTASAHGMDDRPLVRHEDPKSMSRETTFERDLHPVFDKPCLSEALTALCVRVCEDLKHRGYHGQQVGLKLRYADFSTVTRDHALLLPTDDPVSVRKAIGVCLRRVSLDQRLRLLGVRVGKLVHVSHGPESHFSQPELPFFGETTP